MNLASLFRVLSIFPAGVKSVKSSTEQTKTQPGIQRLLEEYRRRFRIPENTLYYSKEDYDIAEKKFVKYAILNGKHKS